MQQCLSQLSHEKENEIAQLNQSIEELQHYIANLSQQHEEILFRTENDKQQALIIGMALKYWRFPH